MNLTTLATICLLAGCAKQPMFREQEETADLTEQARRFANEQLDMRFGTPTESVTWEALPVRFHAARATVDEVQNAGEFTISFGDEEDEDEFRYQLLPIEAGDEVVWLSGKLLQQESAVSYVADYDPETQTVKLADRLDIGPYTQEFDAADAAITHGTLIIQVGDDSEIELTIDESNDTLQGLADAIDAAEIDVTASIITIEEPPEEGTEEVSETFQLRLTADGGAGNHEISVFNRLVAATAEDEAIRPDFDLLKAGDRVAIGPGRVLQHGRLLYAEHCQHCHGVNGDGAGPTAQYLNPRPRDYRFGKFKFTSTNSTRRAQRSDLERVVENGIPGTYMPSFKLLEAEEMAATIEYVMWLSMRGETELKLVGDPDYRPPQTGLLSASFSSDAVGDLQAQASEQLLELETKLTEYREHLRDLERLPDEQQSDEIREAIADLSSAIEIIEHNIPIARDDVADPIRITQREFLEQFDNLQVDTELVFEIIISEWNLAQAADALVIPETPRPPSDPASIARGREVFMHASTKCATCHGEAGLGNGDSTIAVGVGNTEPGLFDEWGHKVQPRDLTSGIYRGGRRPIDIYRRIYSGIKGTPMSGFGSVFTSAEDASAEVEPAEVEPLYPEDIWHLVNYVLSMPFEERPLGAGADVPRDSLPAEQVVTTEPAPSTVSEN